MAIDEQWFRVRRSLEEKLGVEEASYLMDRPAGGWSELVTNRTLDLKVDLLDKRFEAIDARLRQVDARLDGIDARLDGIDARLDGIDARFDAFRLELLAEVHKEFRDQTWRLLTALLATMTALIALFGVILAVVAT